MKGFFVAIDVPEIASVTLIFDRKATSVARQSKPEKTTVLKYLLKRSVLFCFNNNNIDNLAMSGLSFKGKMDSQSSVFNRSSLYTRSQHPTGTYTVGHCIFTGPMAR